MAAEPGFLLFSGHNERAVITLCRFFRRSGLAFHIVAAGRDDAIHQTDYSDRVVFNRIDRVVSVELLAALAHFGVYCPTTEFINHFMLANRAALDSAGLQTGLPAREVYEVLTGKLASQAVIARLAGLQAPAEQPLPAAHAPCVLKPRQNICGARVLYPRLCLTPAALADALPGLDPAEWFAQGYVQGQSHYLCGYLAADGRRAWYWQQNLLQQPGGKSIVLARSGSNPGLDADALFDGLAAMGYRGPFMMELIGDAAGRLHYIEINPRFWGPLQLALDVCPQVLALFAQDHGATLPDAPEPEAAEPRAGHHYYAWAFGARMPGCRRYPAAEALPHTEALLARHDLYAAPDTRALHLRH